MGVVVMRGDQSWTAITQCLCSLWCRREVPERRLFLIKCALEKSTCGHVMLNHATQTRSLKSIVVVMSENVSPVANFGSVCFSFVFISVGWLSGIHCQQKIQNSVHTSTLFFVRLYFHIFMLLRFCTFFVFHCASYS